MALFQLHPLLPNICQLCGNGSFSVAAGQPPIDICPPCEAELPWILSACKSCGLPLPEGAEQLHCGECLVTPPPFKLAITPFHYRTPLNSLIAGFKYRRGLLQGKLLGQLLAREILEQYKAEDGLELPEAIIPVPLHWQRFLWRGYNQSAELGQWLAHDLGIPCRKDLIKRVRRTPRQQGLHRKDRLHNLHGAFAVAGSSSFQRIALLDDVVTTGSTVTEISKLLLQHGVAEIHLWAIARTPVENHEP